MDLSIAKTIPDELGQVAGGPPPTAWAPAGQAVAVFEQAGEGREVDAIAASMGYASRSHFSRAFRSAYGMDPSKFRRVAASRTVDAPTATR